MEQNKNDYKLINLNNFKNKNKKVISEFLKYNGSKSVKDDDVEAIMSLIKIIKPENSGGFVVSYVVERIDKEFDLIKLDNERVINIELKLSNREDKLSQAKQNYQLLKTQYQNRKVEVFSYVKNGNLLFKYNPTFEEFEKSDETELNESLSKIGETEIPQINFNIINAYCQPEFYLEGRYMLTVSQEMIKKEILEKDKGIFYVCGSGGTGKTLLALDIYKYYADHKETIFLIPFLKENISVKLTDNINIRMAKNYPFFDEKKDIVIIDEAQRITKKHLNEIKKSCNYLILFADEAQDVDGVNQLEDFLNENEDILKKRKISQIVRSDSTVDRYARKICGLPQNKLTNKHFIPEKIEILMIDEFDDSKRNKVDYKFIEPTKSKYMQASCYVTCSKHNCLQFKSGQDKDIIHFEIGKEYRHVLLYLCQGYCIINNKLDINQPICYGNIQNQIYTILSRTTDTVTLVCEDIEVYNFLMRCRAELTK